MDKLDEIIEGLKIFKANGASGYCVCAEHDIILVDYDVIRDKDKERLENPGWFVSSEFDSWGIYV